MKNKRYSVKTTNDEVFDGTADEVVQYMSDQKFRPVKSLGGYRRATAKRVKELFNVTVDPTSSETFLDTMIEGKLLEDLTNPA